MRLLPSCPPPLARSLALAGALAGLVTAPAGQAAALDCHAAAERELQELGLDAGEIAETRYFEKLNPTERGPDVLGVRAWIRLQACDGGYLVIDMTRSCFVRQSYTRGECRLDGVTAY
ncbi:MAG TPA: hypothetical protein VIR45_13055 [Kiloniellaceae bacterium]